METEGSYETLLNRYQTDSITSHILVFNALSRRMI